MDTTKKHLHDKQEHRWLIEMAKHKSMELESVLSYAADGIGKFACDPQLTVLYFNEGLVNLVGTSRSRVEKEGFNSSIYIHPDDLHYVEEEMKRGITLGRNFTMRYRLKHISGRDVWVKAMGIFTKEFYQDVYPIIYLIFTDITELVTLNQKLDELNKQLEFAVNRYKAFIEIVSEKFFEYQFATSTMSVFGGTLEDSIKIAPPTQQNLAIFLEAYKPQQELVDMELQLYVAKDVLAWHAIKAVRIGDLNDGSLRIIGTIKNIQAQKIAEAERAKRERTLFVQSQYDPITGLLNRAAVQKAVEEQICTQSSYMLSIIDIDNFKSVNDTYGHVFGDEVLKYVSDILRKACRSDDITGRLGGDEFIMFFCAGFTREKAIRRLSLILLQIQEGVGRLSIETSISISIGAILVSRPALSFLDVYRKADAALYEAKRKGKNTYSLDIY